MYIKLHTYLYDRHNFLRFVKFSNKILLIINQSENYTHKSNFINISKPIHCTYKHFLLINNCMIGS